MVYKYDGGEHQTALTQIGHGHYTYDADGNPTLVMDGLYQYHKTDVLE